MTSFAQISERTIRRDRHRDAGHVALLDLARDLSFLAQRHERFAPDLNSLVMRIRNQTRTSMTKRRLILRTLKPNGTPIGALSISEICGDTRLDHISVGNELPALIRRGMVEVVDSQGRRLEDRHQGGKFTRYYRARL